MPNTETKTREKLTLTKEDAQVLLWGRGPENYEVVSDTVIDNTRWSIVHDLIIKRISDGKFFRDGYSVGATESQDERPWDYSDPDFTEVFPVEKTITVYE
jgi:hypothetical protein